MNKKTLRNKNKKIGKLRFLVTASKSPFDFLPYTGMIFTNGVQYKAFNNLYIDENGEYKIREKIE
jgi:hypothetical protein